MSTENATTAPPVDLIVRRFFPDAAVRIVPAGHVQRFQIVATQGGVPCKLSSHLCVSEAVAWGQADRKVREMFRELFRPNAEAFVRKELSRGKLGRSSRKTASRR